MISAFTYVRNGIKMGYPFIESIKSAIDFVDEYIVVLGDSDDGSREAIMDIQSHKIRIIDSVWDMSLRTGGKLFALQANLGLDEAKGDWILHLQADEVLHEKDINRLLEYIKKYDSDKRVEALLFPFLNFRGDYWHIHTGRQAHRFEIRAFKKNDLIRSYKDSQGFRKFSSRQAYNLGEEKGTKLRVIKTDVPIYHYNYVRPPKLMMNKAKVFSSLYHNDQWLNENFKLNSEFDYNMVDKLEIFFGTHPAAMNEVINGCNWKFTNDPSKRKMSFRHFLLNKIEDWTGYRIGEYKNYKIV